LNQQGEDENPRPVAASKGTIELYLFDSKENWQQQSAVIPPSEWNRTAIKAPLNYSHTALKRAASRLPSAAIPPAYSLQK
jgi:hypothetical protein